MNKSFIILISLLFGFSAMYSQTKEIQQKELYQKCISNKKYIKQNARLIAFNVDPLFNNAVDGLMYIRIADLPDSTVRPVMEEFQTELERKFGPPVNSD